MHRESDVFLSPEELEKQHKVAQRRVFIMSLVVFGVITAGSLACVIFGVSEILSHDKILMNDGLGEIMTVLGICFTLPCIFCIIAFAVLALDFSCLSINPHFGFFFVAGLTLVSFIVQQIVMDIYLYSIIGSVVSAAVIADFCVLGCYAYSKFRYFYIPTVFGVLLFVVKMTALWNMTHTNGIEKEISYKGILAILFLTLPIIQLPLYITIPREQTNTEEISIYEETIVENFNNNFNLLLLHLLNSIDIISIYSSFAIPQYEVITFIPTPEPFRVLIIIIVSVAFVGNNIGLIHLFYKRIEVENAELKCLPKKLRDATNQWNTTDINGSHKRRILQYMLLLLVLCDVPLLAVRMQLWWRGHQMLNIFAMKNIKSILDTVMVVLRVDRSNEYSEHSRGLLFEDH